MPAVQRHPSTQLKPPGIRGRADPAVEQGVLSGAEAQSLLAGRVTPLGDTAAVQDEVSTVLPELLPRLWRFAWRLAGDADAEDLVQRACDRAFEQREQFRPGMSPLTWMLAMVHSVWHSQIRVRQARTHAALQWSAGVDVSRSPARTTDQFHERIVAAIQKLPDAQRGAMLLVAVERLTCREAAEVLDIPIGTLMIRLAAARLTVGQAFAPRARGEQLG